MGKRKIARNLYYLTKRLFRGLKMFFLELSKPTSFLKGEDFEKLLRKKVFKKKEFDLVMKTHDYHENRSDYVEASLYPDYLFRNKKDGSEFWVEAKYREKLWKGKLKWCELYQFKRYQQLSTDSPVYIAIGFGGRPSNPTKIYLIPIEEIKYNELYPKFLNDYEFDAKRKNILDFALDGIYNIKN